MTGAKIENLQALRGIAVLLVLLSHVAELESRYSPRGGSLPDLENLGWAGVFLFFVISGFVMVTISEGRPRVPGEFGRFLYRRVTRIYPLYWIISLVVLAVWLARPGWVNSSMKGHVDLVASFLLLPQQWLPLLGQGWTLIYEIYFYIVFAFSLFLPRRWLLGFLGSWTVLLLGANLFWRAVPQAESPFLHLLTSGWTMHFLAGAFVALALPWTRRWLGPLCFSAGCLGLAVFLASQPFKVRPPHEVMIRALPLVALVLGAVSLEKSNRFLLPRFLRWIGDASYSIYLSHIMVISFVGRGWSVVGWSGGLASSVLILLMVAGAIIAGAACYRFIERPLLRLAHRYSPSRSAIAQSSPAPA